MIPMQEMKQWLFLRFPFWKCRAFNSDHQRQNKGALDRTCSCEYRAKPSLMAFYVIFGILGHGGREQNRLKLT